MYLLYLRTNILNLNCRIHRYLNKNVLSFSKQFKTYFLTVVVRFLNNVILITMPRNSFLYGLTDDEHPKKFKDLTTGRRGKNVTKIKRNVPENFTSGVQPLFEKGNNYDQKDLPLAYKSTPATLLQLVSNFVDKLPLNFPYDWTNDQVCIWIRSIGYPEFVSTFRVNSINGRKLLLLDASALSSMNIKDFKTIQDIVHKIRMVFSFSQAKFSRSISLPSNLPYGLFKTLLTKTGTNIKALRPTDFWKAVHLIRQTTSLTPWEILENCIKFDVATKLNQKFGGVSRLNLFSSCSTAHTGTDITEQKINPCKCILKCSCYEKTLNKSSVLTCMKTRKSAIIKLSCIHCVPPCECDWTPRQFRPSSVLSICNEENLFIKHSNSGIIKEFLC